MDEKLAKIIDLLEETKRCETEIFSTHCIKSELDLVKNAFYDLVHRQAADKNMKASVDIGPAEKITFDRNLADMNKLLLIADNIDEEIELFRDTQSYITSLSYDLDQATEAEIDVLTEKLASLVQTYVRFNLRAFNVESELQEVLGKVSVNGQPYLKIDPIFNPS